MSNTLIGSSGENSAIDYGITIADREINKFNDWKVKEVGLRLVLFGLAEVQAKRIQNLAKLVYKLEEQVFDDSVLAELEPRKLIELYQMSIGALNESSSYIKSTIKEVDWSTIESQLHDLSAEVTDVAEVSNSSVNTLTKDILATLKLQDLSPNHANDEGTT